MKYPFVRLASRCLGLLLGTYLLAQQGMTPAAADTVTFGEKFGTVSKDAMTFQNNPNNGSGGAPGFFAGTNAQPSIRRGYVAFDVSSIPPDATITDVQLRLVIGQIAGSGGGGGSGGTTSPTIGLYEMFRDWAKPLGQTEPTTGASTANNLGGTGQGNPAQTGDVTWNVPTFGSADTWGGNTPGGLAGTDFDSTASASLVQGNAVNDVSLWLSTAALVADVQGWVDDPSSNFGWLLKNNDESGVQTFRGFFSRNFNPNPTIPNLSDYWPQLIVSYQVVPEPGSMLLMAAGMALVIPMVRRRRRAR